MGMGYRVVHTSAKTNSTAVYADVFQDGKCVALLKYTNRYNSDIERTDGLAVNFDEPRQTGPALEFDLQWGLNDETGELELDYGWDIIREEMSKHGLGEFFDVTQDFAKHAANMR